MLTFVGLGLYDERSVTERGRAAIASADRVVAEFYTSRLTGCSVGDLEAHHGVDVEVLARDRVERAPEDVLDSATEGDVAFLVGGDPMTSTTHVDLRLRAHARGIETRLVHGTSAATAAAGLTGLQNYRFGRATTLPFPGTLASDVPESVAGAIDENRERGLHTLVYLDIDAEDEVFLRADEAARALAGRLGDVLGVGIARAGSDDPLVVADRLSGLANRDFGDPLHLLVVPAELHPLEADALAAFAEAPADALGGD